MFSFKKSDHVIDGVQCGGHRMLSIGNDGWNCLRITRGRLDRHGKFHDWRPDIFLIHRAIRVQNERWFWNMEKEYLTEKVAMAVAWRMPRRVAMWCAIRLGAHATTGSYSNQIVPDLTFRDALKRWDE